jgi:hypothetical protein
MEPTQEITQLDQFNSKLHINLTKFDEKDYTRFCYIEPEYINQIFNLYSLQTGIVSEHESIIQNYYLSNSNQTLNVQLYNNIKLLVNGQFIKINQQVSLSHNYIIKDGSRKYILFLQIDNNRPVLNFILASKIKANNSFEHLDYETVTLEIADIEVDSNNNITITNKLDRTTNYLSYDCGVI